MQVADLVDDLQPGPLKDELLKDFDPSQQTYEEYLRDKGLGERPFNAQDGGRVIPSRQELKIIANELAEELGIEKYVGQLIKYSKSEKTLANAVSKTLEKDKSIIYFG